MAVVIHPPTRFAKYMAILPVENRRLRIPRDARRP
jgi:hypothetical protein